MTLQFVLLIGMIVLYACGIFMLLERSFTRIVLGVLLMGNATNILIFLTAGNLGDAPIVAGEETAEGMTDPLPQAFILTAIVITFATTAFMLALLYRSWKLARADEIADDDESVALRDVDPEADDEVFDENDSGDSEFGSTATAAADGLQRPKIMDAPQHDSPEGGRP